ncbi:MAG: hypothetical protein ABII22_03535 [Candidatus Micrarchaeota archaeon]
MIQLQHTKLGGIVARNCLQELKTDRGKLGEVQGFATQLLNPGRIPEWRSGIAGTVQLILHLPGDEGHFNRVKEAIEFTSSKREERREAAQTIVDFLSAPSGIGTDTHRDRMLLEVEGDLKKRLNADTCTITESAARVIDNLTSAAYRMAGLDPNDGTYVGIGSPPSRPMSPGTQSLIANGGREEVVGEEPAVDLHNAPTGMFQMPVQPQTSTDGIAIATPAPMLTQCELRAPTVPTVGPAATEVTQQIKIPFERAKPPRTWKTYVLGGIAAIATVASLGIGTLIMHMSPSGKTDVQDANTNPAIIQPVDGLGASLPSAPQLRTPATSGTATIQIKAMADTEQPVEAPPELKAPGKGSPVPDNVDAVEEATAPATAQPSEQAKKQPMTRAQIKDLKGKIKPIITKALGSGALKKRPGEMNLMTGGVIVPPIVVVITQDGTVTIKGSTILPNNGPESILAQIQTEVTSAMETATLPRTGQRFSF